MTEPSDGGIPQDAMTRLAELQPGSVGAIFTSDLTVNEFLLVKQAGFTPLGMVLGSSIYHVGIQIGRWSSNQELDVLSQAMYHARELAMTRMEQEANVLGADGIVGHRHQDHFRAGHRGRDVADHRDRQHPELSGIAGEERGPPPGSVQREREPPPHPARTEHRHRPGHRRAQ